MERDSLALFFVSAPVYEELEGRALDCLNYSKGECEKINVDKF
jgi:hypothetical protein